MMDNEIPLAIQEKLDAMESIVPPHLRRGAFQPSVRIPVIVNGQSVRS